jgi:uroporphyrin-III C-methyltransferase
MMNKPLEHMTGRVALVGAGPGDPDLLTVKALRLIQHADAIAYDELVTREILALAPAHAMLIAVGRRDGCGATPWPIHPTVIELARAGFLVVRLKCGDPMIFGRGGEEGEALARLGIPFDLVPGITAAAAAGSLGFSLTHRAHAACVVFASGHDPATDDADHCHWAALARSGGTLVLYMTGRRATANAERLIRQGMPPTTPAAMVIAATHAEQRMLVGQLATIGALTGQGEPHLPGLMIVGEIVNQRERVLELIAAQQQAPPTPSAGFTFQADIQHSLAAAEARHAAGALS